MSLEISAARERQRSEGHTGHQSRKNRFNTFCYSWSSLFFPLMVRFIWEDKLQQKTNQVSIHPIK